MERACGVGPLGASSSPSRGLTATRSGTVELPPCWRYLRSTDRGSSGTTTFVTSSSNMYIPSAGGHSRCPRAGTRRLGFHQPPDCHYPLSDRILGCGPGWVRLESISSSGRTYRVVRVHVILVGDAKSPFGIELDPTMTGHFRGTDPHQHVYLENPDDADDGSIDQGFSLVSSSDLSEVQESVMRYVRDLIRACSAQ